MSLASPTIGVEEWCVLDRFLDSNHIYIFFVVFGGVRSESLPSALILR